MRKQTSKRPNVKTSKSTNAAAPRCFDVWTFGRLDVYRRRGFTLVEAIAAMTIFAALGSVAAVVLMSAVSAFGQAATRAQLHTELSIALDRIDRELRNIQRKSGAGTVAPNIASVSASAITWHTNSSLSLSGSNLQLVESGGTARTLLTDVTAFSVQAYDEANTAMAASLSGAACDTIRRLRISITLTREGVTETLRTKVSLRSTMTGAPST